MINSQPIEKSNLSTDGSLDIHSIFYTIQGEGPFCGRPAIFIRLAGCNLKCPSCDTDYTSTRKKQTVQEILNEVMFLAIPYSGKHVPLIVITGGEPLRQNIAPLIRMLLSNWFGVQIETNGTLYVEDVPWGQITVICSPKTGKINKFLEPFISAYKYVLNADSVDPEDGLPILALDHTASPRVARPPVNFIGSIYLQPMDSQNNLQNLGNVQAVKESCMKFGYTLQLQTHKIIGVL